MNKKKLFQNQNEFKESLRELIDKFVENNKVVSIGDRVIDTNLFLEKNKEFEIVEIRFNMAAAGSFMPYLPTLSYYGKPISKSNKIMHKRKKSEIWGFKTTNDKEYNIKEVCFHAENAFKYMYN